MFNVEILNRPIKNLISLELKNGYFWHKSSIKSPWKIVRILKHCNKWVYYFNNEYYDIQSNDQLIEIPEPQE